MAEPYEISENMVIDRKNLDKLVEETVKVLPESVEAAFEYCQIADINRKKQKARKAIDWAILAAAGSAPIPIPLGHAAAVVAIQGAMVVKINQALGFKMSESDGKEIFTGVSGIIISTVAGKAIFAEIVKTIPGLGTVAGAVIGGSVAAGITNMFGNLYLDVVSSSIDKRRQYAKYIRACGTLKTNIFSEKFLL